MAKPRILIVEDETIVAMDIAATLRRLGYEITGTAADGVSAIESARSSKPDLIVMDIRLKGAMDGIEAAAAIQKDQVTPTIFLTAHADADTVERSKVAGPYGYLLKPFDERTLHRAIDIALHRAATEKGAREQTLDALWQSEERFRLLVDAVKDYALFMIDLQGRIASWSPAAQRMTGFTAEEVLGNSLTILRLPDGTAADLERLFDQVRREGGAVLDGVALRKNGTEYLAHVSCTPMLDRKDVLLGYVCVIRDMTEQRSLEAQLAQAQRLESLGQLAGGVAHDFNNMLMVIFARCEILLNLAQTEKQRRYISEIRMAANKNRDLTQQLLGAARQQLLAPHVMNLNLVIASAVQLLTATLGENIEIRQELQEPLWNVHADPGKLHQVLLNLAINARDAMPNGGVLTIESHNVHVDASYARQHLGLRDGDYVSLVISDTGSGIPADVRDRIYDPFFTTKALGQGTGLGLAVVRGIIEQTGGRIWMYSEEGRGTTFKIFLPRNAAEAAADVSVEEVLPRRGTETILLVEDEGILRAIVRDALEEHGYHVLEARTPAEALTINAAYADGIDLLLTDVIMPGMNGRDLAETISATRPKTRIIFMSGYTNHALMSHTALPPGVRHLEKPISTTLLLQTVRATLDER
jgi:PAS domain S-box-containing protein